MAINLGFLRWLRKNGAEGIDALQACAWLGGPGFLLALLAGAFWLMEHLQW
jgi:hypothetical protein